MHAEAVDPAALEAEGVAVFDGFLTRVETHALARGLEARRAGGEFKAARVGGPGSSGLAHRPDIRGDFTCWIESPLSSSEQRLIDALQRLRVRLNREVWLGLAELELHYALYPPGAGYARHFDQPRGRQRRRVSLIVYLNEDWSAGDGGALRIYDAAGAHRDFAPLGGRLVCFMSADHEHEVLPARRERRSVSGWFLGFG